MQFVFALMLLVGGPLALVAGLIKPGLYRGRRWRAPLVGIGVSVVGLIGGMATMPPTERPALQEQAERSAQIAFTPPAATAAPGTAGPALIARATPEPAPPAGAAQAPAPARHARSPLQIEAEGYLTLCVGLGGDDARWCELNRASFVRDYETAHAGDYQAQRNVAFMLRGSTPGVRANAIQSCAWRLVIVAQGHPQVGAGDTSNVRFDCERLNAQERTAAQARAVALAQVIATRR